MLDWHSELASSHTPSVHHVDYMKHYYSRQESVVFLLQYFYLPVRRIIQKVIDEFSLNFNRERIIRKTTDQILELSGSRQDPEFVFFLFRQHYAAKFRYNWAYIAVRKAA